MRGGIKLKKLLIIFGTVFTLSLGIGLQQSAVQASTWHKGMPKALIGRWYVPHDKIFHTQMINGRNYSHIYSNDPGILNNTKYRYLGHHIYEINGYEPVYTHGRTNEWIKWFNHNKISKSNIFNRYTNWEDGVFYRK